MEIDFGLSVLFVVIDTRWDVSARQTHLDGNVRRVGSASDAEEVR